MSMHLLPIYFNDLKQRKVSRKREPELTKLEFSKMQHLLFVEKMTGGKKPDKQFMEKEWRREYRETMQPDMSGYQSRGIGYGIAAKPEPKVYTGNKLLGIATMHKSNMVPVFSTADAADISRMRR